MIRILVALALISTAGITPAVANSCSSGARAETAKYPGASLLSVKSETKSNGRIVCKVKIKLPPSGGKPGRVISRKFNLG